jgi:hypothetical protein
MDLLVKLFLMLAYVAILTALYSESEILGTMMALFGAVMVQDLLEEMGEEYPATIALVIFVTSAISGFWLSTMVG